MNTNLVCGELGDVLGVVGTADSVSDLLTTGQRLPRLLGLLPPSAALGICTTKYMSNMTNVICPLGYIAGGQLQACVCYVHSA